MNRTFLRAAPAGALFLACLAACSPQDAGSGGDASVAGTPTAGNAAAPATGPQGPEKNRPARILLAGGGLIIAPTGGGKARLIPFGTPTAATLEAVAKAVGRGPSRRGSNEECGGGAQTFAGWDEILTLWFSEEGGFVGWDSDGELATAEGVAVGSPRSALDGLEGVEIAQSTLGTEFTASDISGLLASDASDAKVKALWSGSTCVFR